MKRWGMALCCLLLAAVQVRADEGMWLLPYLQKLNIKDMACSTIKMVTDSIDSFVQNDMELAKTVIEYDDVVDSHFDRIKTALTERIRKFGGDGEYTLDLLMIAKYYERMGDHASEIARWVLYSLTGNKEG